MRINRKGRNCPKRRRLVWQSVVGISFSVLKSLCTKKNHRANLERLNERNCESVPLGQTVLSGIGFDYLFWNNLTARNLWPVTKIKLSKSSEGGNTNDLNLESSQSIAQHFGTQDCLLMFETSTKKNCSACFEKKSKLPSWFFLSHSFHLSHMFFKDLKILSNIKHIIYHIIKSTSLGYSSSPLNFSMSHTNCSSTPEGFFSILRTKMSSRNVILNFSQIKTSVDFKLSTAHSASRRASFKNVT